jgi:hypothetical protein
VEALTAIHACGKAEKTSLDGWKRRARQLNRETPARIATAAIVLCWLSLLALVGLFIFRALAG